MIHLAVFPLTIMYLFTPFGIFVLLLSFFKTSEKTKKYKLIPFIALSAGLIGYCTIPLKVIDITRYFYQLDRIRGTSFDRAFNWSSDGLVIKNLVFWLVSQTGDNHILPFITLSIIYGIIGFIVVDSAQETQHYSYKVLLVLLCIIPYYNTFSNVRNVTSFSILILALYRDLWKQKKNIFTFALYIIPCFIHMTGIVIILFRIAIPFIRRFPKFGLILTLGIPSAVVTIYQYFGKISPPGNLGAIVSRAFWKSYSYTVGTADYHVNSQSHGSFIAGRIVGFIFCVGLMLYLIDNLKDWRSKNSHEQKYFSVLSLLTMLTIIWIIIGVVKYWVFLFAVSILSIPILNYLVGNREFIIGKQRFGAYLIQGSVIILLILQMRQIVIYLNHGEFFLNIFFTNYLTVALRACGI